MAFRLEVKTKVENARALGLKKFLKSFSFDVEKADLLDIYTVDKDFSGKQKELIGKMLTNPIIEEFYIDKPGKIDGYDWSLEISFLPGVTDNVAITVKEGIEDLLSLRFENGEDVYSSRLYFLKGEFEKTDVEKLALALHNPLIQKARIKSADEYDKDRGMGIVIPKVRLSEEQKADKVDLDVPEEELIKIGKQGVENKDGSRRGPLALDLESMKVIREYFKKEGRQPTELIWMKGADHPLSKTEYQEQYIEILVNWFKGLLSMARI